MQDTPATRSFRVIRSVIIAVGVLLIIACGVLTRILAPPSENRARVSSVATTPDLAASGTLDYRRRAYNKGGRPEIPT